jgi:hypothetical protein
MKALLRYLIILPFVLIILVPNCSYGLTNSIQGKYKGAGTGVVKRCSFPQGVSRRQPVKANFDFIDNYDGSFSTTGTFNANIKSYKFLFDVDLYGDIYDKGIVGGTIVFDTYINGRWESYSEGTFTGKLKGKNLTIKFDAEDISGDNCIYKVSIKLKRVKGS